MRTPLDIIVVTCNLPEFFNPCIASIVKTGILNFARLIVVNNGKQPVKEELAHLPNVLVLTPGENLGWEGALDLALKNSDAEFVVFQNDDTFLPKASMTLYHRLLICFDDPTVAAVGPVTTCATGLQSIYHPNALQGVADVSYLIFFCVMLRRKALDAVGGIDLSLPGGDDFDLSIRLRRSGYRLLVNPGAFIIHHGFQTGTRIKGDHTVVGGWNSPEMIERTSAALIRKHGFRSWFTTVARQLQSYATPVDDKEGDLIRSLILDGESVLELGCGPQKTVPLSDGIDIVPNGQPISEFDGRTSVADIVADVTQELPVDGQYDVVVARHILEHCVDTVQTIQRWQKTLKPGGRLIIAVPDELVTSGIPLNPEHCHAFTPESLRHLVEACGFAQSLSRSSGNGVSFVSSFLNLRMPSLEEEVYA